MRVLDLYPWVAESFGPAREEQGGLYVTTPCVLKCHRTATVRWWVWGDSRALCLRCWAGCDKLEILRTAGRGWKDCWPSNTDWKRFRPKQEVVARYSYRDELGGILYQTLRLEPGRNGRDKEFRQRRRDPSAPGGWVWSMGDVRRVLFDLPFILDTRGTGAPVFVVAGEKDCMSLRGVGLCGTTNVGGESAGWLDSYSECLSGRDVVVIEDRDSAGKRHANEVVGSLLAHDVAGLRRVVLPAKDATAFLNRLRMQGMTNLDERRGALLAAVNGHKRWTGG